MKNSRSWYSSHGSKHNGPCYNNHCDTKSEALNHAFTLLQLSSNFANEVLLFFPHFGPIP
jgi:hypothetical protein